MLDLVLVCAFVAVIALAVLFHYITKAPEGNQDSGGVWFWGGEKNEVGELISGG